MELTKNEQKAFEALFVEHRDRETFTRYWIDAYEGSHEICSHFMMERLVSKGVVEVVPTKRNSHQPIVYKWKSVNNS